MDSIHYEKTQANRLDMKTWSVFLLYTRNTPQFTDMCLVVFVYLVFNGTVYVEHWSQFFLEGLAEFAVYSGLLFDGYYLLRLCCFSWLFKSSWFNFGGPHMFNLSIYFRFSPKFLFIEVFKIFPTTLRISVDSIVISPSLSSSINWDLFALVFG